MSLTARRKKAAGAIRVGIGGWTYEPWRGTFYPEGLPHRRELEHASRAVTAIEINGSYYSTFKPETWAKWRDEAPPGFVFAVKASRFCTNRKRLADAGPSIDRFVTQGLALLGDRLGPVNWQLAPTKQFDPDEIDAFLTLLPRAVDGVDLRHALEVRHPSFADPRFYDLARRHGAAIVFADHETYPRIDQDTAAFTYARLMRTEEDEPAGYTAAALANWAKQARSWAARGDAFIFFIAGVKVRAPAAAQALIKRLT